MALVKALVLDMDGLLIDSEGASRTGWQLALAEWGLTMSDEEFIPLIGLTLAGDEAVFRERYHPAPPFADLYARKLAWMDTIIAKVGIPLKPGVPEFLDAAEERGLPLAVATSADRARALYKTSIAGLDGRIPIFACGDEVPRGKPAPDVFALAAQRLGVPPDQCLAFEDSDPGVLAASAAGMRVVIVPDLKPPSADAARLAWKVVPTLHDAIALLSNEKGAE
jgi:HAD superfamily hydrolase (TIGR01509 family)